jgi:hypothetical protein
MSTETLEKPVNAAGWKKSAYHNVMCPSGARVVIRIPDLPRMIEIGEIPQHLLDAAIGVAGEPDAKPSIDLIKQQREFTDLLTAAVVHEPKLDATDIPDLPYEDKEFLVAIATRQRDLDAEGEHIGGLMKSEKFRRFRQFREFDPTLADS